MIGTLHITPIIYSYCVMRVTTEKHEKTRETQKDYFTEINVYIIEETLQKTTQKGGEYIENLWKNGHNSECKVR